MGCLPARRENGGLNFYFRLGRINEREWNAERGNSDPNRERQT
jgi:hypothetical protein